MEDEFELIYDDLSDKNITNIYYHVKSQSSSQKEELEEELETFELDNDCDHIPNTVGNNVICSTCGVILKSHLSFEKEWRNYQESKGDTSRYVYRRIEEKGIMKDLEALNLKLNYEVMTK